MTIFVTLGKCRDPAIQARLFDNWQVYLWSASHSSKGLAGAVGLSWTVRTKTQISDYGIWYISKIISYQLILALFANIYYIIISWTLMLTNIGIHGCETIWIHFWFSQLVVLEHLCFLSPSKNLTLSKMKHSEIHGTTTTRKSRVIQELAPPSWTGRFFFLSCKYIDVFAGSKLIEHPAGAAETTSSKITGRWSERLNRFLLCDHLCRSAGLLAWMGFDLVSPFFKILPSGIHPGISS